MTDRPTKVQVYASKQDAGFAEKIALGLHAKGMAVVGGAFDPAAISAVVVIWSRASIESRNLRAETAAPFEAGVLAPVSIGPVTPPAPFDKLQPIDLGGWAGAEDDPRWRFVLAEIATAAERSAKRIAEMGSAGPAAGDLFEPAAGALPAARPARPRAPARMIAPAPRAPVPSARARPRRSSNTPAIALALCALMVAGAFGALAMRRSGGFESLIAHLEKPAATKPAAASDKNAPPHKPPVAAMAQPKEDFASAEEDKKEKQAEPIPAAPRAEPERLPPGGAAEASAAPPAPSAPSDEAAAQDAQSKAAASSAASSRGGTDAIAELIRKNGGEEEAPSKAAALNANKADKLEAADPTKKPASKTDAGDFFKDCADCPEMRGMAAGAFVMGSPKNEHARAPSEGPQTEIAIAHRFAIGAREVTFAQWDACVAGGGCNGYKPPDDGWGRGDQPAVNISWRDAKAYAGWLSKKTGEHYRLPSEAEWEYAARAGTETAFPSGNSISSKQANFDGRHPYGTRKGKFLGRPAPVASYPPNRLGLFDMAGNVWEWVADCWEPDHADAPKDGAPVGGDCSKHAMKGGAWNSGGWRLRPAHRIGKPETAREFDNGFRIARDIE